jgi:hypothetical protein
LLRFFPAGFIDQRYIDWERDYKWKAHERWQEELDATAFKSPLKQQKHQQIARRAFKIESAHEPHILI